MERGLTGLEVAFILLNLIRSTTLLQPLEIARPAVKPCTTFAN